MTNPTDDAANLTGAYALNALDATERAQLEAHIAGSEQARNEVTELTDTAVLLGLAVDPVAPPASLKASIMAQLASTPQLPPVADGIEALPAYNTPGTRKAQARWFTRPVTALAAAAAAVVLIVGGGVVANTITTNTFQQAQSNQLAAIESAPDSQRLSAPVASGGTATLVWSQELASSVLMVDGITSLPSTHVYELWYINEAGARPAGTFTVDASGTTWQVLDGQMSAGDTVGLTVEPRGGSPLPTTDPVVVVATA